MPLETPRILAIDWSGRKKHAERTIWIAEARNDDLVSLECGRDREQVATLLLKQRQASRHLIVGLDFAFSFPASYLKGRSFGDAPAVWAWLADGAAEDLLKRCDPPFWGRRGPRPQGGDLLRRTDRGVPLVNGIRPKPVFQIGGAGAVGTGALRGMAILHRLHAGGFAVWPFTAPGPHILVEIYPRLLTGPVTKSKPVHRAEYLVRNYPRLGAAWRDLAASTEDAFDAAVSALKMWEHRDSFQQLAQATDSLERLEGRIWEPLGGVDAS
jgi:hypothetical protein